MVKAHCMVLWEGRSLPKSLRCHMHGLQGAPGKLCHLQSTCIQAKQSQYNNDIHYVLMIFIFLHIRRFCISKGGSVPQPSDMRGSTVKWLLSSSTGRDFTAEPSLWIFHCGSSLQSSSMGICTSCIHGFHDCNE